jgi:hypothetical protein
MLRSVVRRPSPATIIALLVLVVIAAPLADAAQKAVSSPKAQSAAEKKKKKKTSTKAVEKAKYADNAGKIRGYSVGFAALPNRVVLTDGRGKLPAAIIPAGAAGPAGPAGPPGVAGPNAFTRVRLAFATSAKDNVSGLADVTADCEADERIAGGGHEILQPDRTGLAGAAALERGVVEIRKSFPVVNAAGVSGWRVQAVHLPPEVVLTPDPANPGSYKAAPNDGSNPIDKLVQVRVWAVCVK